MKAAYTEWIQQYLDEHNGSVYSHCQDAVEKMVEAFPELEKVPGHVFVMGWGQRAHWWCVTSEGEIVDPTKSQFPMVFDYEAWVPGTEVYVGKCMNCGAEIYKAVQKLEEAAGLNTGVCSDVCASELDAEFQTFRTSSRT